MFFFATPFLYLSNAKSRTMAGRRIQDGDSISTIGYYGLHHPGLHTRPIIVWRAWSTWIATKKHKAAQSSPTMA